MDYLKIYNQIIEKAKNENRIKKSNEYYEAHHIIPKCLGGEGTTKQTNHPNIVLLTAKEHFLCHRLLCLIYPKEPKLYYALYLMSIGKNKKIKYIISSRTYETIKKEWNHISTGMKKPEGFGDKIKSRERNKKIGESNKKPKPKGFGENQSIKNKGKKRNQEFKNKISMIKNKKIIQLDINGSFLKLWESAKFASRELDINYSAICQCARKEIKSSGDYIWVYEKDYNPNSNYGRIYKYDVIPKPGKHVLIDKKEYTSISQASKETNIPQHLIIYRLKSTKYLNYEYK
jgi:hypothetical protein